MARNRLQGVAKAGLVGRVGDDVKQQRVRTRGLLSDVKQPEQVAELVGCHDAGQRRIIAHHSERHRDAAVGSAVDEDVARDGGK